MDANQETPVVAEPQPAPQTKEQRPTVTPAEREMQQEVETSVRDWLAGIGANHQIKVTLKRVEPKYAPDKTPVAGKCDEYDEPVTEDEIAGRHGGGKFQLWVERRDRNGQWKYFTARTITIPGKPNFEPIMGAMGGPPPAKESDGAVTRAMNVLERTAQEEREERRRLERERGNGPVNPGGVDPKLIDLIQGPVIEQLRQVQEDKRALEKKIDRLLDAKPDTTFQDKMLERSFDGAEQRLNAVRDNHNSELRQLRQSQQDDIKRIEDRHDRTLSALQESHKRELDNLKDSNKDRTEALKNSYEMRIDALKSEIDGLKREITAKDQELARLRAVKEKSPLDAIREAAEYKEHLVELGVVKDNDDEDEDDDSKLPGWVKGLGVLLDNPIAQGIAERLAGGPPPQNQQQAWAQFVAQMPVGKPIALQDGRVIVKTTQGKVMLWDQYQAALRKAKAKQKRQAEDGTPAAAEPEAQADDGFKLDPADVKKAIPFIENAIRAGRTPEEFAASAATMAPKPIMRALRKKGVEWFLDHVDLDDGSPINTQEGRTFLRNVAAILTKGK